MRSRRACQRDLPNNRLPPTSSILKAHPPPRPHKPYPAYHAVNPKPPINPKHEHPSTTPPLTSAHCPKRRPFTPQSPLSNTSAPSSRDRERLHRPSRTTILDTATGMRPELGHALGQPLIGRSDSREAMGFVCTSLAIGAEWTVLDKDAGHAG
jgi:hypothetical protein